MSCRMARNKCSVNSRSRVLPNPLNKQQVRRLTRRLRPLIIKAFLLENYKLAGLANDAADGRVSAFGEVVEFREYSSKGADDAQYRPVHRVLRAAPEKVYRAFPDAGHSLGGKYLELAPHERIRHTDRFDDPNLPGEMQTTITLKRVSCGTELNIVQEGIPDVIPPEACCLGWQESLALLAKLVEAEIPD